MKKPSLTQRKILETAAGLANHRPHGRSQHGGWSSAYLVCRHNNWTDRMGLITVAGLIAIDRAARIVLTVLDHEQNGAVALAETSNMLDEAARVLIAAVDSLVEPDAEPGAEAAFSFVLDLKLPNGDVVDNGQRMLPAQIAMTLAPEAVSHWLAERPEPDAVLHRMPMPMPLDRFPTTSTTSGGE
nr:hypothetical protein [uncultured Shinella sp.]